MSDLMGGFVAMLIMGVCAASWFTHIVTTVIDGEWLLLIAGAMFFPVGMIHGVGIWFGAW